MPFEPGHKNAVGRPKGSKNKDSVALIEEAKRLGVSPFRVLLYYTSGDWKSLGYESKLDKKGNEVISPELRLKGASEAAQFLYPKLRSVEHSESSAFESMTKVERVRALEQALARAKFDLDNG